MCATQVSNGVFYCEYMQVKDLLLQKCLEVEQTAREQATDNAILEQLCKVNSSFEIARSIGVSLTINQLSAFCVSICT